MNDIMGQDLVDGPDGSRWENRYKTYYSDYKEGKGRRKR